MIVDINRWGLDLVFSKLKDNPLCKVLQYDIINDQRVIEQSVLEFDKECEELIFWHLAANSDISAGTINIDIDLNDTFLTTISILDICEKTKCKILYFASSSAVYGDVQLRNNGYSESCATQPISNYGAMKLASEAVIRSAFQRYLDKVLIFRFPNVIGFPATHGVIKDFITRLQINPNELVVLGNGEQNKPYLHVTDLIGAMLHLHEYYSSGEILEVINLGSPHENVFVKTIAEAVCSRVSPSAQIIFGSTEYGWVGDMPQVKFEIQKLISTGWKCKLSGLPAVQLTIDQILDGRENDCIPNPA